MQVHVGHFPNKLGFHTLRPSAPFAVAGHSGEGQGPRPPPVYFEKRCQASGVGASAKASADSQALRPRAKRVDSPVPTHASPSNPERTRKVPESPHIKLATPPPAGTSPNSARRPAGLGGRSDPGGAGHRPSSLRGRRGSHATPVGPARCQPLHGRARPRRALRSPRGEGRGAGTSRVELTPVALSHLLFIRPWARPLHLENPRLEGSALRCSPGGAGHVTRR